MNESLRRQVAKRALTRCEYCLYPEALSLIPHQLDHVIPKQHGGEDGADNLAFSCATCNRVKGPNLASIDPESKQITPLYNTGCAQWCTGNRACPSNSTPNTSASRFSRPRLADS